MELHPDFRELLECFTDFRVEFVVVGGYALAYHGAPRFTGDLDVLVAATPENAERVMAALREFGFSDSNLSAGDFASPERFVRLGHPPVRIDILTSISGVSWEDAYAGHVKGQFEGLSVPFIGKSEFVANKRAAGRTKDLADIEALGER